MAAEQRSILRAHLLNVNIFLRTCLQSSLWYKGCVETCAVRQSRDGCRGCTHHVHLYVVSSSINGMLVALERLFREFAWRPPAIFKMFSHAVWSYVQSIDTVSTQHHKRGAKAHF